MNPSTETPADITPHIRFDASNWVGTDALPRDQEQSRRLHEPTNMHNSIDPITGLDIKNLGSHPYLSDGILTIYFETKKTRQAYLDTPVDHPFSKLPGTPSVEDDRGGRE